MGVCFIGLKFKFGLDSYIAEVLHCFNLIKITYIFRDIVVEDELFKP